MVSGCVFVCETLNAAAAIRTQRANSSWGVFPFYFPDLCPSQSWSPIHCCLALASCGSHFPVTPGTFTELCSLCPLCPTPHSREGSVATLWPWHSSGCPALWPATAWGAASHWDKLYKKNKKRSTYPETARTLRIKLLWLQPLNRLWFFIWNTKRDLLETPESLRYIHATQNTSSKKAATEIQASVGSWEYFSTIKLRNRERKALYGNSEVDTQGEAAEKVLES